MGNKEKVIHTDDICTVIMVDPNHYRVFQASGSREVGLVNFQQGSPFQDGVNGLTMEASIAI